MSTEPSGRAIGRVVFAPRYDKFNPYQGLLAAAIARLGVDVRMASFATRFPLLQVGRGLDRATEVLHLHWLDRAYADADPARHALKIVRTVLEILWLRHRGLRIYYTAHNLHGHEARWPRLEGWALRRIVRASENTFVHSSAARLRLLREYQLSAASAARVLVAEHGNYGNRIASPAEREAARRRYGLQPGKTVFLVFGLLRGYKGLAKLIRNFQAWTAPDAVLLIAGSSRARDPTEAERIRAAAQEDARILPLIRSWPDEELPDLFAAADACVVAHDWQLTSGSLILAMGFGKPLLLPDRDIADECPALDGNLIARPDWSSAFGQFSSMSASQRLSLGEDNARRATALSWGRAAECIVAAYRRAG
ncbi:MAG: hypothetical protein Q8Q73_03065 [Stagnimonas sp.]|nr:hypothetical protein [Stagnimonas sp.]